MAYKVGISSGWWQIAKDPNLLGLPIKAGSFTATGGVQFNQVDMETITEFVEPDLKDRFRRIVQKLGIEIGLHGEVSPAPVALESAERRMWENSHERLCITLKNAAELKMTYVNIHLSQNQIVQQEEQRIKPFGYQVQVVATDGRPFFTLAEKSPAVKKFIIRKLDGERSRIASEIHSEDPFSRLREEEERKFEELLKRRVEEALKKLRAIPGYERIPPEERNERERIEIQGIQQEINRDFRERIQSGEFMYGAWKQSQFSKYLMEAGEIDCYYAVGYDLWSRKDPIWMNIVGNTDPETAYNEKPLQYNAACAAAYLYGHFTVKDHQSNVTYLKGMSMVEWCEKNKLMLLMEMPHSQSGSEGLMRLFHPLHSQHLVRKISSPYVKLTIDFEQTMAQNIDVDDFLSKAPGDFGNIVFLLHLGEPIPYYGTAHIPITIGGQGQEILYRWIYALRRKGFRNGYIIFERGAGRGGGRGTNYDVFEESVRAIRQMVKYLDKDTAPEQLPPEFYGTSFENPDVWARQLVTMRDHAWDPLQDVFILPEEKHFFLGSSAVQKGKGQEWERRKFR